MNLVVSSAAQLRRVYGERETQRVQTAIDELVAARAARNVQTRTLNIEEGIADLAVAGVAASSSAIAAQIAAVAQALERQHDRLESVLIIGGPSIIPFDLAPNPTEHDGDSVVPSDLIYGLRGTGALMPEWPVGRLPGAETPQSNAELLVRLIRYAAQHGKTSGRAFTTTFGYSTAAWQTTAALVYTALSNQALVLSPPTVAKTLDLNLLNGAQAVYCNLHGVHDNSVWYGQPDTESGYFVALTPADVLQARITGALVLSESCYGAVIDGRNEENSLALAFLARGAVCFVGATAMSYGPTAAPLGEADLLAYHFWRVVRQGGTTIGAALLEARAHMLLETLERQSVLDDDDRKTALEFVLYGDPTIAV